MRDLTLTERRARTMRQLESAPSFLPNRRLGSASFAEIKTTPICYAECIEGLACGLWWQVEQLQRMFKK